MKIETKYNIGDEVWVKGYDKIERGIIVEIRCRATKKGLLDIYYDLKIKGYTNTLPCPEEFIFSTKEELIKSLKDESII